MPVQRRAMRWLWWSIAGLLLLGGMVAASLSAASPEWERARRWAAERVLAAAADGCPVVAGEARDGCSRDDYAEAVRLVAAWPESAKRRFDAASIETPREPVDLEVAAEAVARLRAGAHRREDVALGVLRFGPDAMDNALDPEHLGALFDALRQDASRRAAADPAGAAAALLDGVVVAADLAAAGWGYERFYGMAMLAGVLEGFDDELLRASDEPSLRQLHAALGRVDAALPDAHDYLVRSLAHVAVCLEAEVPLTAQDLGGNSRLVAWRSGFSLHDHAVRLLCDQLAAVERHLGLDAPDDLAWPQREAALERVIDEASGPRYGMFDLSYVVAVESEWRKAQAALSLLRQAIAFHLDEPVPTLPDPLGDAPLQVLVEGDRATFASAAAGVARTAVRRPR